MIHQYINNGYYIILDVNSGSVHVTDKLIYDAVALTEPLIGELEKPVELSKEIKVRVSTGLKSKGYTEEDIEEAH